MCFERKDERSKSKTGMGVWNAGHVPVIVRREQSVSDLVWDVLPLSSMGCAVVPHRHVAVLRMKRIRRAVVKNILYCL